MGAPVFGSAFKIENLPMMVAGVMSHDPQQQTECIAQFRGLLSIKKDPPIQQVIEAGVVARFVLFLQRDDNHSLQFEAASALTNIASALTGYTAVVVESGAVPIFVRLLSSPNDNVRNQAVRALGNIAADSTTYRYLALQLGALQPLLQQFNQNSNLSMLRSAAGTLSIFCGGRGGIYPLPDFNMVRPALTTLARLLFSPDKEVLSEACLAAYFFSLRPEPERIQEIIEAGVCRRLVELLLHSSPGVQIQALYAISNAISRRTPEQIKFMVQQGCIRPNGNINC